MSIPTASTCRAEPGPSRLTCCQTRAAARRSSRTTPASDSATSTSISPAPPPDSGPVHQSTPSDDDLQPPCVNEEHGSGRARKLPDGQTKPRSPPNCPATPPSPTPVGLSRPQCFRLRTDEVSREPG